MRSVVLGLGISLDGYIARPDGAFDFLFMPKDFWKTSFAPFMASIDATMMGRKTYEVMGQAGGSGNKKMETYVFSRSLPPGERGGLTFVNEPVADVVNRVRERPGKNIWLAGGGELALDFLKADLVDELYIGIVPTLIGEGIPLFRSGFPQRDFTLVENKTFSQGLVSLKYARVRAKKKPARRR